MVERKIILPGKTGHSYLSGFAKRLYPGDFSQCEFNISIEKRADGSKFFSLLAQNLNDKISFFEEIPLEINKDCIRLSSIIGKDPRDIVKMNFIDKRNAVNCIMEVFFCFQDALKNPQLETNYSKDDIINVDFEYNSKKYLAKFVPENGIYYFSIMPYSLKEEGFTTILIEKKVFRTIKQVWGIVMGES